MPMLLSDGRARVSRHTHIRTHTHAHALWSRQAQTTGTHVERVSEQTFIPALSRSMSKPTRSNFVCQFSALARQHRQLCNHKKPFTCNKHDSLGCFLSCFACSYLRGFFVCLLGDLGANSVRLAFCPARDVRAHLALQYLSNTLIGLLSVCRSKQVLPPGALAQRACAEVHKDPFTFSTLLEAQAPGDPRALMHACIHACVALCVWCVSWSLEGELEEDSSSGFFSRTEHLSASIPITVCVCLRMYGVWSEWLIR